jgi:hypothetical protein
MDLSTNLRNNLKWIGFNIEIIELGSVKYKVKSQITLNERTLNWSSSVLYVDQIYLPAIG